MLFEALPGISVVNFSVSCRMGTDLEGNRLRHPREKASVFWRSGVFRISPHPARDRKVDHRDARQGFK